MKEIDKGNLVGALLVDLSKAFDTISHQQLLGELRSIHLDTNALKLFQSYLSDRQQRVVSKGIATEWNSVTKGVPQGSCLSPLLFNIYVRELPADDDRNANVLTMQFADDATHSAAAKTIDDIGIKLSARFTRTKNFCRDHGLVLNAAKTQLIIFKQPSKKVPNDYQLNIDGAVLTPAKHVNLLGVTLDRHLTFAGHIDTVVNRTRGLLGILRRASNWLPRELVLLAYQSLIRTRLEYASALLVGMADCHKEKLERMQRVAARIICGTARDAHAEPLLTTLGLETLSMRRTKHTVSIIESILREDCHPALRNLFTGSQVNDEVTIQGSRTAVGRRRFSVAGAIAFNQSRAMPDS